MDHTSFMARLNLALKADLTQRSDLTGLKHLAGHLGAILLVGTLIAVRMPGWWLLVPVQGVLIVFLFTLEHEATHKTPFASEVLGEWCGRIAGFLILLPFEWFRYFHLAHHKWTNIEGKDPELASPKPDTLLAWLWYASGLPYWTGQIRLMLRLLKGRETAAYLPANALPRIEREARIMAAGYGLVVLSLLFSPLLFRVWLLPVLLGQPFLRLYLLAEHGDCAYVANMFENTRTTFTNRVVRFFAWNMPYHCEHHVFPSVPFHRLPALHEVMQDKLQVTEDGYVSFTQVYLARRR